MNGKWIYFCVSASSWGEKHTRRRTHIYEYLQILEASSNCHGHRWKCSFWVSRLPLVTTAPSSLFVCCSMNVVPFSISFLKCRWTAMAGDQMYICRQYVCFCVGKKETRIGWKKPRRITDDANWEYTEIMNLKWRSIYPWGHSSVEFGMSYSLAPF